MSLFIIYFLTSSTMSSGTTSQPLRYGVKRCKPRRNNNVPAVVHRLCHTGFPTRAYNIRHSQDSWPPSTKVGNAGKDYIKLTRLQSTKTLVRLRCSNPQGFGFISCAVKMFLRMPIKSIWNCLDNVAHSCSGISLIWAIAHCSFSTHLCLDKPPIINNGVSFLLLKKIIPWQKRSLFHTPCHLHPCRLPVFQIRKTPNKA